MKTAAGDIPCTRDCPDRSAGCHGKCARYLEFRRKCDEIRTLKSRDKAQDLLAAGAQSRKDRYRRSYRNIKDSNHRYR